MFNIFSMFGSPGDSISPEDFVSKNNNIYPTWTWTTGIKDADGKDISVTELISKYNALMNENKNLNDLLKSIEEDGTEEHNKAIKLREENAQLKVDLDNFKVGAATWNTQYDQEVAKNTKLEDEIIEYKKGNKNWMNLYQEVVDKNKELLKEVNSLRDLKEENVNLIERNRELLEKYNGTVTMGGLKYMEAKLQIVQNNYKKCSVERDEFKHQLNAANKENKALKNDKEYWKEQFDEVTDLLHTLKKEYEERLKELNNSVVDVNRENKEFCKTVEALENKLRDYQDKYAKSFSYEDMYKLEKEIDQLKRWKKEQLTVQSWWDKVDSYVRDHDDAPLGGIVANTCLNFLKERDELKAEVKKLKEDIVDYVIEKDDELKKAQDWNEFQKHPMYPIHWGGITNPLNEKQDKDEWQCPCNKCKDKREGKSERSWEEAASDLTLKIIKLEKQIEELKIVNTTLCQKLS